MNVGLQESMVRRAIERQGADPEAVDVEALVDSSLSLPENLANIERQLGCKLRVGGQEADLARQDNEWSQVEDAQMGLYNPGGDAVKDPEVGAVKEPEDGTKHAGGRRMPHEDAVLAANIQSIAKDPELRASLQRIVGAENAAVAKMDAGEESFVAKYGWEASDVPVPPHHVRKLLAAGIIRTGYKSNKHTHYLLVNRSIVEAVLGDSFEPAQNEEAWVPGPGLVERFERVAASGDALSCLCDMVAPSVHGLKQAKQAVLLALSSLEDAGGHRARVHVLLEGPPGTGKTNLMLWAAKVAQTEVYSPRMTGAGLTVDMRSGQPGVLPQLHASEFKLAVVDELEKCDPRALKQTLQALEEGRFTAASANGTLTLDAAVRLVAAVNDARELPPEFVDRMDFHVDIPLPSKAEASEIIQHINTGFRKHSQDENDGFVRDYIRWVREYEPEYADDERALVNIVLTKLVSYKAEETVRIRSLVSVIRVAYAIARLNKSPVTAETVLASVRILHDDLPREKLDAVALMVKHAREKNRRQSQ